MKLVMDVYRYSAAEGLGLVMPDSQPKSTVKLIELMEDHGILPHEITVGTTDITPDGWAENSLCRYQVVRDSPAPQVAIDKLHVHLPKGFFRRSRSGVGVELRTTLTERIMIPDTLPHFAIAGPSPRYKGKLCLHELIIAGLTSDDPTDDAL